MSRKLVTPLLVVAAVIVADRITKSYALHWIAEQVITPFLLFQLTYNRGISWGMLHHSSAASYLLMGIVVATVTLALIIYAYRRLKQGQSIVGEALVIGGSLSNLFDRFYYGGVIDFIVLHKGSYVWPVFNVADICIVLGIFLMFVKLLKRQ
jgi:signal peptidase II